jgi:hypothetical protein
VLTLVSTPQMKLVLKIKRSVPVAVLWRSSSVTSRLSQAGACPASSDTFKTVAHSVCCDALLICVDTAAKTAPTVGFTTRHG